MKLTGHTLIKLECVIEHDTDIIKLTLWQDQIPMVEDGKTYKIQKWKVRTFQGEKYIALNEESVITLSNNEIDVVPKFSEIIEQERHLIVTKIDGVESLQRYARCKSCKKKLTSTHSKLHICEICGLQQIINENYVYNTSISFLLERENSVTITLTMFEDSILKTLEIYNNAKKTHVDL